MNIILISFTTSFHSFKQVDLSSTLSTLQLFLQLSKMSSSSNSNATQQALQEVEASIDAMEDALEATTALLGLCSLEEAKGPRKSGKGRLVKKRAPTPKRRTPEVIDLCSSSSSDDEATVPTHGSWGRIKEAARMQRLATASEAPADPTPIRWSRTPPTKRQCLSS
jgi:hypothetical protein